MFRRTVSAIILAMLLTSALTLAFNIQPAKAASETIIDTHGDSRFTKYPIGGAYWWSRSDSGAYNGNFWYTYCGDAAHGGDLYWGKWDPPYGQYAVSVWIPNPTAFPSYVPTHSANYDIYHSGGFTEIAVNQALRLGGWYSLGSYTFASGSMINLDDRTGEPYISTMVAFDAIKFTPIVPPCSLTVSSAHDSPNPSSGVHSYNNGQSVICSVTSPVTEGSTRWICTGWSGTGSAPSSGSGTSVTFTITQDSSITWNWIPQPRTLTVSSAHDSPNPSNGAHSYSDGQSVTCSVTSPVTEGGVIYTCTSWSGTGSVPSSGSGTSVTFTITQDSSITWIWPTPVQRSLTVSSAHDSPNPSVGSHQYQSGSSVPCSVSSPVTEGSTVWTCTGWSGSGSVPSSGGGTSVSFTITQDSSITWNWVVTPENHLPSLPISLNQFKSGGSSLGVGDTTTERIVVFKARLNDPDGDAVKLEVELRNLDEYSGNFNEGAGGFKDSDLVASGNIAVAYANELIDETYHWRARTVDEHEARSEWVDFGGNDVYGVDFAVDTTPPETSLIPYLGPPEGAVLETDTVSFTYTAWDMITSYLDMQYSHRLEGYDAPGTWSDWISSDTCSYTDLLNGQYTFQVRAKDEVGYIDLSPAERSFTVAITGPHIYRIEPPSGAPGIPVKITGINLQSSIFGPRVNFGGITTVIPDSWTDTEIIMIAPGGNGKVEVKVLIDISHESNSHEFTYDNPLIDPINPSSGKVGEEVTIGGTNLGDPHRSGGVFYVKFGGTTVYSGTASEWTDNEIVIAPPSDFGSGRIDEQRKEWMKRAVKIAFGLEDPSEALDAFLREALLGGIRISVAERRIEVEVKVVTPTGEPSNPQTFTYIVDKMSLIDLMSPGELRVYDSQGRVTGLVNGEIREEIPYSYCTGNTIMLLYSTDSYSFEVKGEDQGEYGLSITQGQEGQVTTFFADKIPISPGEVHSYSANWTIIGEGGEGVDVKVDTVGDGIFEYNFTSDSELSRFEYVAATTGYDLAINGITFSKNIVSEGYFLPINAAVTNFGIYPETFNLAIFANGTLLTTQVITLANATSTTFSYDWDTTGFAKGNYTLSAYAEPVPGETYTADNNSTGGWIMVSMDGDLTGGSANAWDFVPDGVVDGSDLIVVARCFGSWSGAPPPLKWNANCDITNDGSIDGSDLIIIARHFGETSS